MNKRSETVPHCVPKTPDLEKAKDDPCWENYVMVGRKPKKSNNEKRSSKMNKLSGNEFSRSVMETAEFMLDEVTEAYRQMANLKKELQSLAKLSKRAQPGYLENANLIAEDIGESISILSELVEQIENHNSNILGDITHRRFRMAEDKGARFHEGPKGEKEFEEWFEEQPQDFQEDWEDNRDEVVEKSKKATLSLDEYKGLLRRASTRRRG